MYERFFNVQRLPFSMVPDPDCIFMTGQHADVISGAVYGVLERKGCILLTGEAGLGKTTALRGSMTLLNESGALCSLIIHPTLDAAEFLELALINFGISPVPSSKALRLQMLEAFLHRADAEGRVCVLIVDEAHKLYAEALEEIRLLGNLESNGHKLLQIVLAGQNELVDRLNQPDLWQLKQRIAFRLNLQRLDREAVEQYIRFRWKKAGGVEFPFDEAALDGVAAWSHGIPRVVNAICDNALLVAFSETSHHVGVHEVEDACAELDLPRVSQNRRQLESVSGPPAPAVQALRSTSVPPPAASARLSVAPKIPAQVEPSHARVETGTNGLQEPGDELSWGARRPSLLKRWLGLSAEESAQQPLSLKRNL